MLRLLQIAFFFACLFTSLPSQAKNFTSAELTYSWVADSTFTFTLNLFSPCDTVHILPPTANICYFNSCNSTAGSFQVALQPSGGPSTSSIPNKYVYSGDFTIPSQCDSWTFHATVEMLQSINLAGTSSRYIEATLNNADAPAFSSPVFLNYPKTSTCLSQSTYIIVGAHDPDNDSIVLERIPHLTSAGGIFTFCGNTTSSIPYASPYSFTSPGIVVHPIGMLVMSPTSIDSGYQSYAVRVNKYRRSDGKKLGSVMRDAQIRLRPCPKDSVVSLGFLPSTFTGISYNGPVANAYANSPVSLCVYGSVPPGTNHHLKLSSNAGNVLSGTTFTTTSVNQDSIVGCLTFTPSISDTGDYALAFTLKDSVLIISDCFSHHVVVMKNIAHLLRINHPTSINNLHGTNPVGFYPNPASTSISINASSPVFTTILSMEGKTLIRATMDKSIDISGLSSGVYLVQIRDEGGTLLKSEKLIKVAW